MAEFDDYSEQEERSPNRDLRSEISKVRKKLAVLREERLSLNKDINKRKLARIQNEISLARKEYSALKSSKKATRDQLLLRGEVELAGPKAKIRKEFLAKPTALESPKSTGADMHEYLGVQSDVKELLSDMSERLGSVLESVKDQYGSFEQAYKSLDENNVRLIQGITELHQLTQGMSDGSIALSKENVSNQLEMMEKLKDQTDAIESMPDSIKDDIEDLSDDVGDKLTRLQKLNLKLSEFGEKIASHDVTTEMLDGLGRGLLGPTFVIFDELLKSVTGAGTTLESLGKVTKFGFKALVSIPKMVKWGFVAGQRLFSKVKSIPEEARKIGSETVGAVNDLTTVNKEEKNLLEEHLRLEEENNDSLEDIAGELKVSRKKSLSLLSKLFTKFSRVAKVSEVGFKSIQEPLQDITTDVSKIKKEQKKKSMLGIMGGEGKEGKGLMGYLYDFLALKGAGVGGLLGKVGKLGGGLGRAAGAAGAAIAPYALPALGVTAAGAGGYAIGTGIDKLITKFSGGKTLGESVYDLFHRNEAKPAGDLAKLSKVLQAKMSPEAWNLYGKDLVDQNATPSMLLKQGKLVESGGKWKLPEEAVESPGKVPAKNAISPTGEVVASPKKPPVTTEPPTAPMKAPEKATMSGVSPRSVEGRSIRSFPVLVDDLGLIIANSGLLLILLVPLLKLPVLF